MKIDIVATVTFAPSAFDAGPVRAKGRVSCSEPIKPHKAIATVKVTADDHACVHLIKGEDLYDIALVAAHFDGVSLFPPRRPPTKEDGAACCAECHSAQTGEGMPLYVASHDSLGCGVAFPVARREITAEFEIEQELLCRLPEGPITSITVEINFSLFGPRLR